MAQERDSLAFRVAMVLGLAVIVLLVTTWAAPPQPANDTATPIPRKRRDLSGSTFEFVLGRRRAPRHFLDNRSARVTTSARIILVICACRPTRRR
jgi:hypothetical protein